MPPCTVQVCDGQGRQDEIIGEEYQGLVGLRVDVFDAVQLVGVVIRRGDAAWYDDLVADDSRGSVSLVGVEAPEFRVPLGAQHEMRGIEVQGVQAGEVETGTVHDVEGTRFRCHDVQDVDIMEFSFGDVDECGYVSAQVEKCVEFDGCLGLAEPCPWEE